MFQPQQKRKPRPALDVKQTKFEKAYISTLQKSLMPPDGLADMTNMTLEQVATPRPRPPLAQYGTAALGTIIGMGTFTKIVNGRPEFWEISMQVIGGVGKICTRKDGDTWVAVVDADNEYDDEAWTTFTQSNLRVYASNGVDTMSFYNIEAETIVVYDELGAPGAPAVNKTGLASTTYTYYYRISANNEVGESVASTATTIQVSQLRDSWDDTTNYVTVTWSAVGGAVSYNVYVGDTAGNEYLLTTVVGLAYKDDNSRAPNPLLIAPSADSTAGPILTYMWNKNGQLLGVGDVENAYYFWFSGQGTSSGDFSPFNGGGYVAIDYGGDSVPIAARPFRDGRGNPVVTVLSRGAAGYGKLHHVTFDTQVIGDTSWVVPSVHEASGQAGSVAALAVVESNNSLIYPTGTGIKSTGTKASFVNLLTTDNVATQLEPDLMNLNLSAMDKARGLEYQGKVYFAFPVGSDENNEIWIYDQTRRGVWILRWPIAAKHMWLYEDNSGTTHFCVLVGNKTLEFTRSAQATTDDGVAFSTRVASGALVWDETGMSMAAVEHQRFKYLFPRGEIDMTVYGLGEDGPVTGVASDTYEQQVSFTGWDQFMWDDASTPSHWDGDIGAVDYTSQSVAVVPIEVDEILNQLEWEITTDIANCDYLLASARTTGKIIEGLYYGD